MFRFGGPNIRKMAEEHDVDGLVLLLARRDARLRLEAAEALAGLNDGRGWRYLLDAVRDPSDEAAQAAAAEILGQLGHPRAVPALQEAAQIASGEAAEAVAEALLRLNVPPPEPPPPMAAAPERPADARGGLGSILGSLAGGEGGYEGEFVEPAAPAAFEHGQITVHPAETHYETAAQLRESEMQERGLVSASLAAWLRPDWAEVWYLRGVLLEDLERPQEAALAYRRAVSLDPRLSEAREALDELDETLPSLPTAREELLRDLTSGDWQRRRDVLAVLDARMGIDPDVVAALFDDEEREVRHAAYEAAGRLGLLAAAPALLARRESSWLLRFAIIEALSSMGAVEALAERLRGEMAALQERNPVFTSLRDPLVELEYDLLLEVGLLALERTGDVAGLLDQAEGNAWETVDGGEPMPMQGPDETGGYEGPALDFGPTGGGLDDEYEEYFDDLDVDEIDVEGELLDYVDETALMVAQALERLAPRRLPDLPPALLERLSRTPDLTLLDPTDPNARPALVHDFAALRAAAAAELARRA